MDFPVGFLFEAAHREHQRGSRRKRRQRGLDQLSGVQRVQILFLTRETGAIDSVGERQGRDPAAALSDFSGG